MKQLNKTSEIIQNIITTKIKPLIFKFYETFTYEEVSIDIDAKTEIKKDQTQVMNSQTLPHLVLFPLFEIMDPK